MQKHKYNIVLKENIIKELSKKTGKSEELLSELVSLHYKYVHHLIDTKESPMLISIPVIGKLCFNFMLGSSYLRTHKKDDKIRGMLERFRELLSKGITTKGMVNPVMFLNAQIIDKKFKVAKYNIGLYAKKLEEHHNNWVSKYFKDSG